MAISVKDIQEKEFPTQANGYAVEQVYDFLDEIAAQLGTLIRENLALAGHVKKLEEELGESRKTAEEAKAKRPDYNEAGYFKNLESAMRESLIGAQRLADETKTKAQAEADELLNKARDRKRRKGTGGSADRAREQRRCGGEGGVRQAPRVRGRVSCVVPQADRSAASDAQGERPAVQVSIKSPIKRPRV